MRTDVKVGLFLGIAALLLAGWMYWPAAVNTNRTLPVGDLSRPVTVTIGQPGAHRSPTVEPLVVLPAAPSGSAVATTGTPGTPVPPATPSTSGGPFSPRTAVANVPIRPTEPVAAAPATPSPSMTSSTDTASPVSPPPAPVTGTESASATPAVPPAPAASASAEVAGAATIGRSPLLHVVKNGQTLEQIADEYYKQEGKTYDQVATVNMLRQANPQLAKGRQLRAGTKIRIPDPDGLPAVQPVSASPSSAAPTAAVSSLALVTTPVSVNSPSTQSTSVPVAGGREYKVQRGDTLYSIATRQLGSPKRWQEVLNLNSTTLGGKPAGLKPGQVLRLPS